MDNHEDKIIDGAGEVSLPPLTLELFQQAAREFADKLSRHDVPELYGVTDGKAVGTWVEARLKSFLEESYNFEIGNAAKGLDFPSLNTDLKVTSSRQPQSSCPFRNASQKVYGLGYNLLVVVYTKTDDVEAQAARLDIDHVIYIDEDRTGDYTLTRMIRAILDDMGDGPHDRDVAIDELDALFQDKNVPLDDAGRITLAEQIVADPPLQGYITISNALQWRLQYNRAIKAATEKVALPEVVDLRHAAAGDVSNG